jgi:hypothetical protein
MAWLVLILLALGASGYLGYWLGVRRERGRYRMYQRMQEERKARGGVRLRRIRIRSEGPRGS